MKVTPVSLSFEGQEGGADPELQNVEITNNGTGTLNWTAVANGESAQRKCRRSIFRH